MPVVNVNGNVNLGGAFAKERDHPNALQAVCFVLTHIGLRFVLEDLQSGGGHDYVHWDAVAKSWVDIPRGLCAAAYTTSEGLCI